MELQRRPEAKVTEGVSIDDYSTWRAGPAGVFEQNVAFRVAGKMV